MNKEHTVQFAMLIIALSTLGLDIGKSTVAWTITLTINLGILIISMIAEEKQ